MPDEGNHDQIGSPAPEVKTIDPILQSTIFNKDKDLRAPAFEEAWKQRWNTANHKAAYFQTEAQESPFSQYSSRGWKIHIAFEKGKEKDMAKFLFTNGLYFKLEGKEGTYFNSNKASGSTVYIGSHDNMATIAEYIEKNAGGMIVEGIIAVFPDGKKINVGSGSDIEIKPKITARLDVQKTKHGIIGGDGKYGEYGMPTWFGLGGIPLLASREKEASIIIDEYWNHTEEQRKNYFFPRLKKFYEESKAELVKDFGQEFVFGSKNSQQPSGK